MSMSEHDSFKSLHKIILEFIKVEHKNNNTITHTHPLHVDQQQLGLTYN